MFLKIDHVNISVNNLAETINWYQKVFGFNLVEQGESGRGNFYAIIEKNDFMICLTEKKDWKMNLSNQGEHKVFHFGFRINNKKQWLSLVEKHNLELSHDDVDYLRSNSWYVIDPSGHEIEVSILKDEYKTMFN